MHSCRRIGVVLVCVWSALALQLGNFPNSLGSDNLPRSHVLTATTDPTWELISADGACEFNDEGILRTFGEEGHTLETCKSLCISAAGCQAIDFFWASGWCNTFDSKCKTPKSSNGASSHALGMKCPPFRNGDMEELKHREVEGPVYANAEKQFWASTTDGHNYVFVIGMPYTGTTALLSLLSSSPEAANMCSDKRTPLTCEGTWLLSDQGLIPEDDQHDQVRWNPEYPKDWNHALDIYRGSWNMSRRVLIDKSPPNSVKMLRIAQDLARTGKSASFIVLSRSPCYLNETQTSAQDLDRALQMADDFQQLPSWQVLHLQYEELLSNPYGTALKILDFMPQLRQLDPTRNVWTGSDRSHDVTRVIANHPEHAGKDESIVGFIESRYPFSWPPVTIDQRLWARYMQTFGY